eukprot:TRINITY_DN7631_c0_g1_i1.p1 TRINITY_DN7631_c0_g1~~TRINITY_DN7631_c0_g1_i1.p1  ORF type:complete len:190 (+),score=38.98 TRINITY_DN7631_c0_g1_i1:84-572(+)
MTEPFLRELEAWMNQKAPLFAAGAVNTATPSPAPTAQPGGSRLQALATSPTAPGAPQTAWTTSPEQAAQCESCHREFTAKLEAKIETSVRAQGKTLEEFFALCKRAEKVEEGVGTFLMLLNACTDYSLFLDLMRNDKQRRYFFKIMVGWKNTISATGAPPPT